jgi:hypothetical protein
MVTFPLETFWLLMKLLVPFFPEESIANAI